ncbi:tyrosine-protein kinase family protein [Marivita hallyeonensis]|uniref:CobQ/CobB/MinD/ParA nucleotide binding domain-containing protein n=1 Tax=Marivita hallyeonensis TaxID=996342 RepID=A0A1M5UQ38_9RHOB|nr:CpsD/CapB family tyrosine-protein kinase [Marivita hallyeonensis]SHH65192.1 CobQ/CobB/MinD/ParA nucleotide binding domain-containing protein [Marivita hallyeonensis]
MTEQPKFQRRKRRGAVDDVPTPTPKAPKKATPPRKDINALLAEKEALLQRKAALKAEVARKKAQATQVSERPAPTVTTTDAKPRTKSRPLVLASPPRPKAPKTPEPKHDPEAVWSQLDRFALNPKRLAKHNVITALREDPAHTRFDILRTRMLQALAENGWRRVAITSPTKDCGKTFTAANLAISLSRHETCRTVLLDLDMRSPSLHKIFGVSDCGVIGDMLRGEISPERHLQGFANNTISAGSHVAIGFNGMVEPYAAELLQDPATEKALQRIEKSLEPDVMLFDLPPALLNDDVLAMRPHFDALLIVAGGGTTRANDIKETERRLGSTVPLLGVILNKADQSEAGDYAY